MASKQILSMMDLAVVLRLQLRQRIHFASNERQRIERTRTIASVEGCIHTEQRQGLRACFTSSTMDSKEVRVSRLLEETMSWFLGN